MGFDVTLHRKWTVEILVQSQRKVDSKVRKQYMTSSALIMFFSLLLILNYHFITCETCLRITLILSCNRVLIRVL